MVENRMRATRPLVVLALAMIVLSASAAGCARPTRPTVTGAELYARIQAIRDTGQATIGSVSIRKDQVLTTGPGGQSFGVAQVIEKCRGGDPAGDVDCTLALLLDQQFLVMDYPPEHKPVAADREDRSASVLSSVAVVGLATAAVGGLVYGVATCEFPGCEAVFGVPLVLVGGAALFVLASD